MRPLFKALPPAILFFLSIGAQANPITYGMQFRVDYALCSGCSGPPLDPRIQIGNAYRGAFTVDDAILTGNGMNLRGTLTAFRIAFEDLIWDMDVTVPSNAFRGFRGPDGIYSASPGFDVSAGKIVNLRGGVFGDGDFPFVDFSTDARLPGDPTAENAFWTNNPLGRFGGTMSVYEIDEPGALALLVFSLLGVTVRRSKGRIQFKGRAEL